MARKSLFFEESGFILKRNHNGSSGAFSGSLTVVYMIARTVAFLYYRFLSLKVLEYIP